MLSRCNVQAFRCELKKDITDIIFTIQPDGSNYQRLTQPHAPGLDLCPNWSPDGKQIAYLETPTGATYLLNLMNTDGSGKSSCSKAP